MSDPCKISNDIDLGGVDTFSTSVVIPPIDATVVDVKVGNDFQFKPLIGGTGVTIDEVTNTGAITISAPYTYSTLVVPGSTATVVSTQAGNDFPFKPFIGGQNITIDQTTTANAITISTTSPLGIPDFAEFYALMPGDNAATVAVGANVQFPNAGPTAGLGITQISASTFQLAAVGIYQILSQVSVDEPGQLGVVLNAAVVAKTVVGRATGTSQIVVMSLITTTLPNSIIGISNVSSPAALTITPIAGGTSAVSASLIITRLR